MTKVKHPSFTATPTVSVVVVVCMVCNGSNLIFILVQYLYLSGLWLGVNLRANTK